MTDRMTQAQKSTYLRLIRRMQKLIVTQGTGVGKPLKLLDWQKLFIRGVVQHPEAALSIARGNGKTTLCAALVTQYLLPEGAAHVPRGEIILVASSVQQARIAFRHVQHFLKERIEADQEESGQKQYPWRIIDNALRAEIEHVPSGTILKCIGSDPKRAHGLAPSIVICDEPAKWPGATSREMHVALNTAIGKQDDAKFIAIGTRPEAFDHWFSEMLMDPTPFRWVQNFSADRDDDDFAMATIKKANPSYNHMASLRKDIKRQIYNAKKGGQLLFSYRAMNLNKGTPEVDQERPIVTLEEYRECIVRKMPAREGKVAVGIDLGGGNAMTAIAFYWPMTGRLEVTGCFPAQPSLIERGKIDAVGMRYAEMEARGELFIFGEYATDNIAYIEDRIKTINGEDVIAVVADTYKQHDVKQAAFQTGLITKPIEIRRVGTGPEGSEDVRSFQNEVLERQLKVTANLALESAIANSKIRYDDNGNPALKKSKQKGRIDVLQATIIAVGIGRRHRLPTEKKRKFVASDFFGTGDEDTESMAV